MQEVNWHAVMASLHDAKFSAIPLNEKRIPLVPNWNRYNDELPDGPLYRPNQKGVGIALGFESGICCVDPDSMNPIFAEHVMALLPFSPVRKRGSKNVSSFYRCSKELEDFAKEYGAGKIRFPGIETEVFISSGYVAIPPSHHEKTGKPYTWEGAGLLDVPKELLPELTVKDIEKLEALEERLFPAGVQKIGKGGRHDTLKDQGFAALHKGKTREEIAKELVNYDYKNHKVPWFQEEMRAHNQKDALRKAEKFVNNLKRTFDKKNPPAVLPKVFEGFQIKKYPRIPGMIGQFQDAAMELSPMLEVSNLMAGCAYTWFATEISSKVFMGDTAPNLYSFIVADSGTGKQVGPTLAKYLLSGGKDENENDLPDHYGSANFSSIQAIITAIESYESKLFISDECGALLDAAKSAGSNQSSIYSTLCDMFSNSMGVLMPMVNKKRVGEERVEKLVEPKMNLLLATTVRSFKAKSGETFYDTGFGPRCLFFTDIRPKVNFKNPNHPHLKADREKIRSKLKSSVEAFRAKYFLHQNKNAYTGVRDAGNSVEIDFDPAALKHLNDVDDKDSAGLDDLSDVMKEIMHRKIELVTKLAINISVSRGNFDKISIDDVKLALEIHAINVHNQQLWLAESTSRNEYETNLERVFSAIRDYVDKKTGKPGPIPKSKLTIKTQHVANREVFIKELLQAERILYREETSGPNNHKISLYWVNPAKIG